MKALYKNNELVETIYSDRWVDLKEGYKVSPPVAGWSQEIEGDVFEIIEYTPLPVEEEEEEEVTEE